MYSVVLAAMLSTTPATPQWGHGCHGCWGCYGCWGCWGCYGCWGCWGGWGWGWPAYYGWGWPYYGYYGWGCGGAFGCAGGGYAAIGCYGTYGWGYAVATPVLPAATAVQPAATAYARGTDSGRRGAAATVVVQAPARAKIFVENKPVRLNADGSFTTPRLQPGSAYVYQIRADVVRDGRVISDVKKVRVWAGRTSRVSFEEEDTPAVAAGHEAAPATTRITVRLPGDAKLYVNDQPCPLNSATRSFDTPPLDPDREYTYTLKAEMLRDGRTRVEKKTVAFRAGQPVTVDFRDLDGVRTAGK